MSVCAEDTGLEVDALNGAPGVYSARYAGGSGHDSEANMTKLLHELGSQTNRQAQFRTVIALYLTPEDAKEYAATNDTTTRKMVADGFTFLLFEGIVRGSIITERRGGEGFGYDPIFYYPPMGKTTAEMAPEEKNRVSHRANALRVFYDKLKEAGYADK